MSDTSAAVLEGVAMPAHIILWSAVSFFTIAVIWAYFSELDEVTHGSGKVIPSSDIQVIQNLEGGIVEQVLVNEGDIVDKEQVLMIIDDTQFSTSLRESQIKTLALKVKITRLLGEANGTAPVFSAAVKRRFPQMYDDELSLYKSRQQELQVKIDIAGNEASEKEQELQELQRRQEQLKISYDLLAKELKLTYPLAKQGAVSQVDILRLERQVNDLKGELEANELAMPKIETSIETAKKRQEEIKINFQIQSRTELNQAKSEKKALTESNLALTDKVQRTSIRSPVRGIVNQINIKTIGGILQPGAQVMEIVPLDDRLLIEAEISPADIGFISPGLEAMVKLTAYDFSIYGGLKAKVVHISADTVLNEKKESVYQIRLRTKKNHIEKSGKKLPIISGMRATVDILTGHKSVLDYLLKPILKTKQNAFTER
jgi:membrane fusion protein, adhesin transport system